MHYHFSTVNTRLTKIKQNSGHPNAEYDAMFKHIHQNVSAYPRSKKTGLINNWETTLAYWKESEQSKALGN